LREVGAGEIVNSGWLDRQGQLVEGSQDPEIYCFFGPEFVVAAADVLDERVPGANHLGRAEPFESTHRSQSGLEPTVIGFDGVIRVVLHDMARRGQQLIEHPRIRRSSVGAHLCWAWAMLEGAGEELASGRQIRFSDTNTSMTWPYWSIAR
jgi:hypothetical protein